MRLVGGVPTFRSTIAWETRKWLHWETFLYTAMQKPALGVMLLAVLLPVSIIILPLMPLITLLTLRPPPEPSGAHAVGFSDCCLPLPARDTSLRLRIFYPSAPHITARGRSSWLPPGRIAGRYATGHGEGLPFPERVRSLLGPYMTWALRFARLPRQVVRDAPPATAMVNGGWPLVVFSHGLYGCAASYSGLCAEMASHGSVVIALEHKDGSAVYTETDDGHSLRYTAPEKEDGREVQQDQRVEEVCSVLESIDELAAKVARLATLLRRTHEDARRRGIVLAVPTMAELGE
jgi:platelet-activating factor acetylhydrolase